MDWWGTSQMFVSLPCTRTGAITSVAAGSNCYLLADIVDDRAGNAPLEMVLEHSPAASHTYPKSFTCKHVTQYAGLDSPKLTKMLMWFNRKSFAALEPLECA